MVSKKDFRKGYLNLEQAESEKTRHTGNVKQAVSQLQQHASGELVVMCQVDGNWSRARPTFAPVKIKSGLAHEYIGCDAVRIKHLNRNAAVIPTLVESVLLIDFHISSGIVFCLSLKRLRPENEGGRLRQGLQSHVTPLSGSSLRPLARASPGGPLGRP